MFTDSNLNNALQNKVYKIDKYIPPCAMTTIPKSYFFSSNKSQEIGIAVPINGSNRSNQLSLNFKISFQANPLRLVTKRDKMSIYIPTLIQSSKLCQNKWISYIHKNSKLLENCTYEINHVHLNLKKENYVQSNPIIW